MCLTTNPTQHWWNGAVGLCLRRPPREIGAQTELDAARRDPSISLSVNPTQVGRLSARMPIIPPDATEIMWFFRRLDALLSLMFTPHHQMAVHARYIHRHLLHDGLHLKLNTDAEWKRFKPREHIHYALELERLAFNHFIELHHFTDPELFGPPKFFTFPESQMWVAQMTLTSPTVMAAVWEPGLAPPQNPLPPYAAPRPPPTDPRPRAAPARPGRQPQAQPNRQPTTPASTAPTAPPVRSNASCHATFTELWNNATENQQRTSLAQLLSSGQSSIRRACTALGLNFDSDCAQFHIRGRCTMANCTRDHTPRTLNDAAVHTVAGQLQQGLQIHS